MRWSGRERIPEIISVILGGNDADLTVGEGTRKNKSQQKVQ